MLKQKIKLKQIKCNHKIQVNMALNYGSRQDDISF